MCSNPGTSAVGGRQRRENPGGDFGPVSLEYTVGDPVLNKVEGEGLASEVVL